MIKPPGVAQTSALDFEEQNFFTMGNDDESVDVASLSVEGNLLKTDSGFARGKSAAGPRSSIFLGKSAMSHPNPAKEQFNRRKRKNQKKWAKKITKANNQFKPLLHASEDTELPSMSAPNIKVSPEQ